MLMTAPLLARMVPGDWPVLKVVCFTLLIHASFIVTGEVPVLLTTTAIQLVPKIMFVICICSVFVNVNVSAPIHAATAMLTATVTAMSMIDATTGLRALTFFLIFIFPFIPPFRIVWLFSRTRAFKSYDSIHHINHL